MNTYVLMKSDKPLKKWRVITPHGEKQIYFGQNPYQDYTQHYTPSRMELYLKRHSKMGEDWSPNGINTSGWWSRWLLWSKPNLDEAIKLIEKKFKIDIVKVD